MMIGVMEITHVEKVVGVVRVELEAFGDVGEERVNVLIGLWMRCRACICRQRG